MNGLWRSALRFGLLVSLTMAGPMQCKTPSSSTSSQATEQSRDAVAPVAWRDVTVNDAGESVPCQGPAVAGANNDSLCLFANPATGLIWTAPPDTNGEPVFLTWTKARGYCKALRAASIGAPVMGAPVDWRLPTITEYTDSAKIDASGGKDTNIVTYSDVTPGFGKMIPGEALWTNSRDDESQKVWTVSRSGDQLSLALNKQSSRLTFRCVRSLYSFALQSPSASNTPSSASSPRSDVGRNVVRSDARNDESGRASHRSSRYGQQTESGSSRNHQSSKSQTTQRAVSDDSSSDKKSRDSLSDVSSSDYTKEQLARTPDPVRDSELRRRISTYLRRTFDAKGFDSHLLGDGGDLNISSVSGFVFSETTGQLPTELYNDLTGVVGEYVRVLAAMSTLEAIKIRVQVIGFASPTYHGAPQVGYTPGDEGGSFNRALGLRRAEIVTKMLRGVSDAKSLKIETISMGSLGGIINTGGHNTKCGEFDCVASRRVIVRFHPD